MSDSNVLRVLFCGSMMIASVFADEVSLEEDEQTKDPYVSSEEAHFFPEEQTYGNHYEMSEDGSKMTMSNRSGKLEVSVEAKNTDFISECEYEREKSRKEKAKSSEKSGKRHQHSEDKDEEEEKSKAPGVKFHAEWSWK